MNVNTEKSENTHEGVETVPLRGVLTIKIFQNKRNTFGLQCLQYNNESVIDFVLATVVRCLLFFDAWSCCYLRQALKRDTSMAQQSAIVQVCVCIGDSGSAARRIAQAGSQLRSEGKKPGRSRSSTAQGDCDQI